MAHYQVPGTLPQADRNADSEVLENRPTHLLPIAAPLQLPLVHFETGSVLEVSTGGPNPGYLAYEGTSVNDHTYGNSDDNRYSWNLSASSRGYDTRVPGCPISLALSPPQTLNGQGGMLDEPLLGLRAYGTIYTDDVRMKLGDGIRRQCFNCRTTDTKTWRRSKLNHGKLVCNKCGLFERSHSVPRPEVSQLRRRSRLPSVNQSGNPHPPDVEASCHYNDHLPVMPFASVAPHPAFSAELKEGDGLIPQDATWMTHNAPMPDVSSVSSIPSAYPTGISLPTPFRTDFQSPTAYPIQQRAFPLHPEHHGPHHPM